MTSHLHNDSRPPDPAKNPSSAGNILDLNRSNSTAYIFLGGARKSWMSTGNNPDQFQVHNNTNNSRPATTRPASVASSVPPASESSLSVSSSCDAPTPPVAAVSSPAPTRPPGMRNLPSHFQQNLAAFNNNIKLHGPSTVPPTSSTSANTQHVPPSRPQVPPTADDTPPSLTHSPASRPLPPPISAEQPARPVETQLQQLQKQQLQQQSQLQAHLHKQSAASLPSPDPTIPPRSHTSPSSAIERNGPIAGSPSVAAFPSPPYQQAPSIQRPRQNAPPIGCVGAPHVSLPSNQQERSNPPPTPQRDAPTGPYTSPVHSHPASPAPISTTAPPGPRPPPQPQATVAPATGQPSGYTQIINDAFFPRAQQVLEATLETAGASMLLSESVETPRIQLLIHACAEQDLVYFVLHQVYCLSSYAPSEFKKLPGVTPKHFQGLDVVRLLLVDNQCVSGDFLRWCVHFPHPLPTMLKDPAYLNALNQVLHTLIVFVDRWAAFEQHVRSRGYPPLVDDMAGLLGILSPVLQYNIFLCLSRRIPGAQLEGRLQEIFRQNLNNFKRRYVQRITEDQQRRENALVIEAYLATIAGMKEHARVPPRANGSNVAHPSLAAPAPSVPVWSQAVSASVPAPATLSTTPNPPPYRPQVQIHPQTHTPNGLTPASVRSPPVEARPRLPRPPNSAQSPAQQRGTVLQFSPVTQTAGVFSSPTMTTTPPNPSRHELPQAHQVQQSLRVFQQPPRPQSARAPQPLPHPTQISAGYRAPPSNLQYGAQQQQQQQRNATLLLPPTGVPPVVNTRPNPNRLAIHQAHLRDPVNRLISLDATGEKETELLPYPTSFLVDPKLLGQTTCAFRWQFSLSQRDLKRFPTLQSQGKGQRMLRTLMEGNLTYRLRCIKVAPSATEVGERSWSVAETVWPCAVYVFVNDMEMFPRRKLHNGRDLPLDITQNLQEGVNTITVHLIRSPAEQRDLTYAMAVEALTFCSLSQAKDLANCVSASESRKQICSRLAPNPGDDDELRIVSDDLMVTLIDPFTARLVVVPVRGRHCVHAECFDHETFLQTRTLKSGDRSAIEADWRCPICGQDARPQSLVVDEFLVEVREQLERTNRSAGARALQIKADGSWEVKTDEDLLISDQGIPQPSRTTSKRKSNVLENGGYYPFSQRPKIDRSASIPGNLNEDQPSVIILD